MNHFTNLFLSFRHGLDYLSFSHWHWRHSWKGIHDQIFQIQIPVAFLYTPVAEDDKAYHLLLLVCRHPLLRTLIPQYLLSFQYFLWERSLWEQEEQAFPMYLSWYPHATVPPQPYNYIHQEQKVERFLPLRKINPVKQTEVLLNFPQQEREESH